MTPSLQKNFNGVLCGAWGSGHVSTTALSMPHGSVMGGGLGIVIHMLKEFCHQVTNGAMCYIKCTLGAYEEPTYFVTESGIILSSVPANVMCIAESARLSSGD